jgi:hypothetical protein
VDDEALLAQHGEQVVDGRAGQLELAGDGGGRQRRGVPGEQLEHAERLRGGRGIGHRRSVSYPRRKRHESLAGAAAGR